MQPVPTQVNHWDHPSHSQHYNKGETLTFNASVTINSNDNLTVDSKFIFGMGKISITVTANITGEPSIQRKTTLFVFGSLIFQTPERLQKLIDRFNK